MNAPMPLPVIPAGAQTSRSIFAGDIPEELLNHIRAHVVEFGMPVTQHDAILEVDYVQSKVQFQVTSGQFEVVIAAPDATALYQTREAVIYLLDHVFPDASAQMVWSGEDLPTPYPPNFQIGRVLSVRRITANFLRVTIKCPNLDQLASGAMHFSLLIPPDDRPAVWPKLNEKRRTVWPTGKDQLHRAAYTFVAFDHRSGSFSFDIFEHAGGHTMQWAQSALPGAIVGVMGPGGGDFPTADDLLIAGDETALPAIRRILENAPETTTGQAIIEVGDAADVHELQKPKGITVKWLLRPNNESLSKSLSQITHIADETFVWLAAERDLVRKAKADLIEKGASRAASYFSGYWTNN